MLNPLAALCSRWRRPRRKSAILIKIKARRLRVARHERMGNFVFRCPRTGMNVQHRMADEPAPEDPHCSYEAVVCAACSRLHFINRSSRKLLGQKER